MFVNVVANIADLSVGFPRSVRYDMLISRFHPLFQILARCKADKGNARSYKYPRSFESDKVKNWFSFLLQLLCRTSERGGRGGNMPPGPQDLRGLIIEDF